MPITVKPVETDAPIPIVTHTFEEHLPAIVIAQRLYQDGSRANELVKLNNAPHPLFMPKIIKAKAW